MHIVEFYNHEVEFFYDTHLEQLVLCYQYLGTLGVCVCECVHVCVGGDAHTWVCMNMKAAME